MIITEEIIDEQKANWLLVEVVVEILLTLHSKTTMLEEHEKDLHTKLKNLNANFERISKKGHNRLSGHKQLAYFELIRVLESLVVSIKKRKGFSELLALIKAWEQGQITVIHTTEELLQVAKEIEA